MKLVNCDGRLDFEAAIKVPTQLPSDDDDEASRAKV